MLVLRWINPNLWSEELTAYWRCGKEEVEREETQVCTRTILRVGYSRDMRCHPSGSPELTSHARHHRRSPWPPVTEAARNSTGVNFKCSQRGDWGVLRNPGVSCDARLRAKSFGTSGCPDLWENSWTRTGMITKGMLINLRLSMNLWSKITWDQMDNINLKGKCS